MLSTSKLGSSSLGVLARFGLLALVPVVALGAVLGRELNVDVQQRYIETARSSATLIAQVGIQPLLTAQEVASGLSPAQTDQIAARLHGAGVSQEVTRIKVWNPDGTIVYSDNPALIGKTFPIDGDLGAALTGHSTANITSGHDSENAGDILNGPLIQVYVPLVFGGTLSPSGAFELYLPYQPVQAAIDRESHQFYWVLAAGLTLFYASMFPVALLADRWRRRLLRESETAAITNLAVLERLNRLKSEFLIRISHQFRTALVGIQGFGEVIRDTKDLDAGMLREFAADIVDDAKRLDLAFNEMIELDRMEALGAILKIAPSDVNLVIGRVVAVARVHRPTHVLATRLDPSVPPVPCDKDKFLQVLTILIDNAIKYSPAGSTVAVTSSLAGEHVEITVKDQGPGMPGDFDGGLIAGQKRQAGGTIPGNGNGATGLGLPIARQIVAMHGGRIWFDGKSGHGSEFHVTLPLQVKPAEGPRAAARAS